MAKKIPFPSTIHDHTRVDEYYWLRERSNQEVTEYLEEENEYTRQVLAHTEGLQEKLYNEIVARIQPNDQSVPYFEHGYTYYNRYEEGKEYALYCRKKGNDNTAPEELMLDENKMAEGLAYFAIGNTEVSPNNELLAYSVDTVSRRQYAIMVKNLKTGEVYPDRITNTTGNPVWGNDNKTIFYSRKDEVTLRPFQVYRHTLGTPETEDKLVYQEDDEIYSIFLNKSKSGKYIFIGSTSTDQDEYLVLDADKPEGTFNVFQPRTEGLKYNIFHFNDIFYIRTNYQDARNYKIMTTPVTATESVNWKEFIQHREDVLIEALVVFNNYLVLEERANALTEIRILNKTTNEDWYIEHDEEVYNTWIGYNPEFETTKLRFGYTSLTTPTTTYEYDMSNHQRDTLKREEVLGDFSPDNYETKRVWATAKDGTQIPISLVYRKGIELNGQNPLLLYAYGSYGYSTDPAFRAHRLSLLDRGVIYAIAHIRGGKEMGEDWYLQGRMLNKKNTFTDFNDCAEYLIQEKYTQADKLCAYGGSAGGLLMGAIINMRPDLYKAVLAAVPFVDVVTTMLDESIPLTTGEFSEWGNPKDSVYYYYMLSYSPYDNVKAQDYPALLVTTGLHDSQVQYWEPAKWVAKLRATKTDDNVLLLYTNMDTGHGGASGRFAQYRETAMEYAFFLDQVGIEK